MAKTRTVYICQNCGRTTPRQMGKCPDCGQWNTMVESVQTPEKAASRAGVMPVSQPVRLAEIEDDGWERLPLPVEEFSRVLGGGVVPGSIVLIDAGIEVVTAPMAGCSAGTSGNSLSAIAIPPALPKA